MHWPALHAGARALALAEAVAADPRPWACVVADTRELERLAVELRFFGGPELEILTLPDWEILPYDQFSPHADIVSERLATLARLPQLRRGIVLLTADSLLARLPPVDYVGARSFALERGAHLEIGAFRQRLVTAGYGSVSQVSGPGEFALRGSLFDVWPMGTELPVRIDLLDDRIDSLRRFDPETQRSLEAIEALRLLPARELPLDAEAVREFRRRYRLRFSGEVTRHAVYRGVSEGMAPPGIEYYLPLFFESTASLVDYLPDDLVFATDPGLEAALHASWEAISARHEQYRHDVERPLLAPEELLLPVDELNDLLERHARLSLESPGADDSVAAGAGAGTSADIGARSLPPRSFQLDARASEPLAPLLEFLRSYPGRVLLAADSPGRREVISQMLAAHGRQPRQLGDWRQFVDGDARLAILVAPELRGLGLRDPQLMLLAEGQLFGTRARQERRRRRAAADPATILRDLQSLEPGAPVVHSEYGVGRYQGLEVMEIGGHPGEFLVLEYRDGDRLYVPVHALHLVNRYAGGSPEGAPLHKLGTEQWARAARRAAAAVRDVAAELLDLHARRAAHQAPALRAGELEYQTFANGFPFEETADQSEAIARVLADLDRPVPMDRIICGDVGFGKTEVAMRAAFVAVQSGRQVVVLVPTTLLAEQHAPELPRPLRRLAGAHRGAVALPRTRRCRRGAGGFRERQGRYPHRHPQAAARRCARQPAGAADRRRGASLRGARQGTPQGAARRSARADAHGDADPAHAQHGPRRPARALADQHAAGGAPGDQDLRVRVARADAARRAACANCGAAARSTWCTTRCRASRRWPPSSPRWCRRRRCASGTGRCASATSSSSWSISITGASTCWCAPPSSRAASTCRPPTPS